MRGFSWWQVAAVVSVAVVSSMTLPASSAEAAGAKLSVDVLSSRADQVSGGDALLRVRGARQATVTRNGADVTSAFHVDGDSLVGRVTGLRLGWNTVRARGRHTEASVRLRNFPLSGPIFSGPHQQPFLCTTERNGLGQPLVDNHDGQGMRVFAGDRSGPVVGWSRDCGATTTIDYLYRTTGGQFKPLPGGGVRPADLATTTTLDGKTVDYVVRRERGTIDRFIYAITMLAPLNEDRQDDTAWNRRLIYHFDGGVGIGHSQGSLSTGATLYDPGLAKGYAVIYSTGTRTDTHYNLILGGETALMTKEHFVEEHGVPDYTVGVGGSGGGIQQYVYGQNYGTRVIDAAIPQYSYPDMTTQTIHVGDCELLEYYMDVTDAANPKWKKWSDRSLIEGLNASDTLPNPYNGGKPGSTECVNGWRGLTPLALNPKWTSDNDPNWQIMDPPGVKDTVKWTHWDDARNVYGVGPDGYARSPWDNVGVQYGLTALRDKAITPAEFLDLNARVGGWKAGPDMVQEGCPYVPAACADPAQFDPWSARNMRLSPDGGVTPAPRTSGDPIAARNAYDSGLVFRGRIDIPIIDWRHYLEDQLNMHNTRQSFVERLRMLDYDGNAANQVIWFTDARPSVQFDQTPQALAVMDQWMAGIRSHPARGVAGNRPPQAVDRCFDTQGAPIAAGPHVWDGILDHRPAGACTQRFPVHGTSRTVAGGPFEGNVYKCRLQPVRAAVARGLYGSWHPDKAQAKRLEQIFPTGVCDYTT
jgi:hypothetical protein